MPTPMSIFVFDPIPGNSHSCCNAKIYGKTVLNEEIPVNKYQKKINDMSKLVETMFIIIKF